jgi:hypothetical protein
VGATSGNARYSVAGGAVAQPPGVVHWSEGMSEGTALADTNEGPPLGGEKLADDGEVLEAATDELAVEGVEDVDDIAFVTGTSKHDAQSSVKRGGFNLRSESDAGMPD